MATNYGFTTDGWVTPTWAQLRADAVGYVQDRFGAGYRTDRESVLGKVVDLGVYMARGVYEAVGTLQAQLDPLQATGSYLDIAGTLAGVSRLQATASVVDVRFFAPVAHTVPSGTTIRLTGGDGLTWTTDAAGTVASGETSVVIRATASTTGPRAATALDPFEFVATYSGYEDVTSIEAAYDSATGRSVETDEAYRVRVFGSGTPGPTPNGIKAALLGVSGVENVTVTINRGETTDASGRPPGAFEAVVWPESSTLEDGIAEALWQNSSATGAGSYGAVTRTVTDSDDVSVDVSWTWGAEVGIDYAAVVIRESSAPADWADQVKAAVKAYLDSLDPGDDVVWLKVAAAVSDFSWVTSATVTMRRDAVGYGTADISISATEVAGVGSSVSVS